MTALQSVLLIGLVAYIATMLTILVNRM